MTEKNVLEQLVSLDVEKPIWDRCFMVSPLVLVGTRDQDGSLDLAPKHMAMPLGWQNYFGFVCSPQHSSHKNIERTGEFTISYPTPSQVLYASLAASPRNKGGTKPVLKSFDTFSAKKIDGEFISDAYLFLECIHHKTIAGFGENCLITGQVVAAHADPDYVRGSELDDQELIHDAPLMTFLPPGRFATIKKSNAFPFPVNMRR